MVVVEDVSGAERKVTALGVGRVTIVDVRGRTVVENKKIVVGEESEKKVA